MRSRPNIFAAVAASLIVLLSVSPLLYGLAMLHVHLPSPPQGIAVLFFLGVPGVWLSDFAVGYSERSIFVVGLVANWAFYFLVFRLIAWCFRPRHRIRRRAELDAEKSERDGS
jgi:hypothetical protein